MTKSAPTGTTKLKQIDLKSTPKGMQVLNIDTEEDVEWFINNYVTPAISKTEAKINRKRISQLERQGIIPQGLEN